MTHTKESIKASIMEAKNTKSPEFLRAVQFEFDGFSVICAWFDHFSRLELLAKTSTGGRFFFDITLSEVEFEPDAVFKQYMTEEEAAEKAANVLMMLAEKPLDEVEEMAYHNPRTSDNMA